MNKTDLGKISVYLEENTEEAHNILNSTESTLDKHISLMSDVDYKKLKEYYNI